MAQITVKEANLSLIAIILRHLHEVQSGKYGAPTAQDLEFCAELHALVEGEKVTKV